MFTSSGMSSCLYFSMFMGQKLVVTNAVHFHPALFPHADGDDFQQFVKFQCCPTDEGYLSVPVGAVCMYDLLDLQELFSDGE